MPYGIVFYKILDNSRQHVFDTNYGIIIVIVSYDPTQQTLHHIFLLELLYLLGSSFISKATNTYYILIFAHSKPAPETLNYTKYLIVKADYEPGRQVSRK